MTDKQLMVSTEWMGPEITPLPTSGRRAIFTVGVSASGKTTWAEKFAAKNVDWTIVCRDKLRATICDPFSWVAWKKMGSKGEKRVTELQQLQLSLEIAAKRNIIIADTNLTPRNIAGIKNRLMTGGYLCFFKSFPVDWKTAVERDNARAHGVGVSVLAQQFERLHALERQNVLNGDGRDAVLCDIDGTLAHMTARTPYEYDKVATDSCDMEILDILKGLQDQGYDIVIVSGRDGVCRQETRKWLEDHFGQREFFHYQRATGDTRPDDLIKEELLAQIIKDGFKPTMVFDDRPRVTRMWRRLGLKVFQVGNPYIEF